MKVRGKYLSVSSIKPLFLSVVVSTLLLTQNICWADLKKEIEFWGMLGAGLASVGGTLLTWGLGGPLQASILIHVGGLHLIEGDPYDPNYHEVYIPTLHDVPDYPAYRGATQEMANLLNTALDKGALAIDYMRAFRITVDRWRSARLDEDIPGQNLQWGPLTDYFEKFSNYSLDAASATSQLYALLNESSVANPYIPERDIVSFWSSVLSTRTFPKGEEYYFSIMGLTPAERNSVLNIAENLLEAEQFQGAHYFDGVNYISAAQKSSGGFVLADFVPEIS